MTSNEGQTTTRLRRAVTGPLLLNVLETLSVAPFTRLDGLQGAAMWYDGMMRSPQRVVIEMIRWACSLGATALNYVQAERLIHRDGAIRAVRAVDGTTGEVHEFETAAVANCAGPWAGSVASAGDGDGGPLFRPSLAFNLLHDREPLSQCGLAVSPPRAGGGDRAYFLCPFHGRILAGTSHVPWHGDADQLHQVLANLLVNAQQALQTVPLPRRLRAVTAADDEAVWGTVSDNGPGIPEDEIETVLASFGQGSLAQKTAEQGAGLGLPIVQKIMDLHQGRFDLFSKLRFGTEVIATFPRARVMDALAPVVEKRSRLEIYSEAQ